MKIVFFSYLSCLSQVVRHFKIYAKNKFAACGRMTRRDFCSCNRAGIMPSLQNSGLKRADLQRQAVKERPSQAYAQEHERRWRSVCFTVVSAHMSPPTRLFFVSLCAPVFFLCSQQPLLAYIYHIERGARRAGVYIGCDFSCMPNIGVLLHASMVRTH